MTCKPIFKPNASLKISDQLLAQIDDIIGQKKQNVNRLKTAQSNLATPADAETVLTVSIVPVMLEMPDTIDATVLNNSILMAESLQKVIDVLGATSIKIKRGYDKSAPITSLHLSAKAVDFYIPGVENKKVGEVIVALMKGGGITSGGVGIYPTHVHLDISGVLKEWSEATEAGNETEVDKSTQTLLEAENANKYKEYSSRRRSAGVSDNDSTPIQDGAVAVPAIDASGNAVTGFISSDASLTNSRWRLNFLRGIGLTGDINQKILPKQNVTADYDVDNAKPWGPHWGKCRPPGMHKLARKCSKKGATAGMIRAFGQLGRKDARYTITEVVPINKDLYKDFITNTGWQKSDQDAEEFWLAAEAVFKLETGEYVGIPQGNFDFRPSEQEVERPLFNHFDEGPFYPQDQTRKKGNYKITKAYRVQGDYENRSVWGAWQYTSDTWQEDMEMMIPNIIKIQHNDWVYPWLAPVKYEIGARLWRYKDLWNVVRGMEVGLQGTLHLAQKASVMYMFNHQPAVKDSFLQHYATFRIANPTILNVVEMFYKAWEDKGDNGLTKWLPGSSNATITDTSKNTAKLGYKISTKLYSSGVIVKDLPAQFRHTLPKS